MKSSLYGLIITMMAIAHMLSLSLHHLLPVPVLSDALGSHLAEEVEAERRDTPFILCTCIHVLCSAPAPVFCPCLSLCSPAPRWTCPLLPKNSFILLILPTAASSSPALLLLTSSPHLDSTPEVHLNLCLDQRWSQVWSQSPFFPVFFL